ncbi:MAG: hypothetical protein COA50_05960 [Flavobacteriaceae bacterium]|nr:MAG: hypothetical protein COA50_05960 [Flavobacteriaceae bacterium]
MTIATLIYGIIPPIVDLTKTHVFHHDWTPHSKMHMVWLLGTNTLVSFLALYFLWWHHSKSNFGIQMNGILGLCVYGGFMISAATAPVYGGAMSDHDGVPSIAGIDSNILAFSTALGLLLLGWLFAKNQFNKSKKS